MARFSPYWVLLCANTQVFATVCAESLRVFDHSRGAAPRRARATLWRSSAAWASGHMPIFSDGIIVDWPHLRKVHQHEEQRVPGECKRSVWCQQRAEAYVSVAAADWKAPTSH